MNTKISQKTSSPARWSMPGMFLRVEDMVFLATAVALYAYQDYSWLIFALLFLAPDLSFAAYAINKRVGSVAYNAVHTYALPLMLALVSLLSGASLGGQLALIWLAHIALDRLLGYGLKYAIGFKDTHLARV